MEESVEQKIIRNIQGQFAVFKTPEVVGEKNLIPNIEWENPEDIDKFFLFAKNLGAKVIYIAEGEEEDEDTGEIKNTILQVGFLQDGIMHHINFVEDDDDEEDEEDTEEESEEYEQEEEETSSESDSPTVDDVPPPTNNNQFIGGDQYSGGEYRQDNTNQPQQQPPSQYPSQGNFGAPLREPEPQNTFGGNQNNF